MIEIRRCRFPNGVTSDEGIGIFAEEKLLCWASWDSLKDKPINLVVSGCQQKVKK